MIGVLFVCLGNICRSPLAEAVFRQVVADAGLLDVFAIDSAGTSAYHTGEPPDPRTLEVAHRRGLALEHAARQIAAEDLERYRYIVVMDESNLTRVRRLAAAKPHGAELLLLRTFDPQAAGAREVPDPYFGGARGFEDVQEMIERSCRGLLEHIREREDL